VTDLPSSSLSLPGRLGVTGRMEEEAVVLQLTPQPHVLVQGVVRVSALSFLIDAAAGIPADGDPDSWTFTADMSIHMRPVPAPEAIVARTTVLRAGKRSFTALVELVDEAGCHVATGAIGFVNVPRRAGDPRKIHLDAERTVNLFRGLPGLSQPLREEAAIEVIDAAAGVVEVAVTPALLNPAGTLQGAMVALVAESAAEELASSRLGAPVVVTDLELRYLCQAREGPVRTRCRLLGAEPHAPVQVELIDTATDRIATLAFARAVPV
jgi:acyl-coenzyme A thioesterase PaaI-like protein